MKYKIAPQILAMLIGFLLGLIGRTDIARPLLIVGGATLATTVIKNGLIEWLIETIVYDVGGGVSENGKTLLESMLGVSLTTYFLISPQSVSTAVATIAIIGTMIWVYFRFGSPDSIYGWAFLSMIIIALLSFLFFVLVGLFSIIPDVYIWGILVMAVLLSIGGILRDYKKPNIPKL